MLYTSDMMTAQRQKNRLNRLRIRWWWIFVRGGQGDGGHLHRTGGRLGVT